MAARGLRYQYLRTLERLLDVIDEPAVGAVLVEGDTASSDQDKVDFLVSDCDGGAIAVCQVKSVKAGGIMSGPDTFAFLAELVEGLDAPRYELLTNAVLTEAASDLTGVLATHKGTPSELRDALLNVLADAPVRRAHLSQMSPRILERLSRARVLADPRDLTSVRESLRQRLQLYRNNVRDGLGSQAAGLLTRYLVDEIFERAASEENAVFSRADFRDLVLTDAAVLAATLGTRSWGVVVGSMPPAPDVPRNDVMDELLRRLEFTAQRTVRRVALVGLSGIGKSSLAAGFIAERADSYDLVCWLDASSASTLRSSFHALAAAIRPDIRVADAELNSLFAIVQRELGSLAGRWAVVYDNVDDPRSLRELLPTAGAGDVIITAINSAYFGPDGQIDVPAMTPGQARLLLANRFNLDASHPYDALLDAMAHELGFWPLALAIGAGYMTSCEMAVTEIPTYLRSLKLPSLADPDSLPFPYPKTLVSAIELCLRKLNPLGVQGTQVAFDQYVAWAVLLGASYLGSRQIPVNLIALALTGDDDEARETSRTLPRHVAMAADSQTFAIPQAMRQLRKFSLASRDADLPAGKDGPQEGVDRTATINTVVQEVVRAFAADRVRARDQILDKLAFHLERWLTSATQRSELERAFVLFEHAETLAMHIHHRGLRSPAIALFFGNLATAYSIAGDYHAAEFLLRDELGFFESAGHADEEMAMQTKLSLIEAGFAARSSLVTTEEICRYLEQLHAYASKLVPSHPGPSANYAARGSMLAAHGESTVGISEFVRLRSAFEELLSQLPPTGYTQMIEDVRRAGTFVDDGNYAEAEVICRRLQGSGFLDGPSFELGTHRILAVALAHQQKWPGALAELHSVIEKVGAATFVAGEVYRIALSMTYVATVYALQDHRTGADHEAAAQVLHDIVTWPMVEVALRILPDAAPEPIAIAKAVWHLATGDPAAAEEILIDIRPQALDSLDKDGWRVVWQWARAATLVAGASFAK